MIVASIGSLLVLWLGGANILWIYLATVLLYPAFLTLPLGTIDFTAARIVIIVGLLRIIFDSRAVRSFRVNRIDILVVVLFAWGTLALMITEGGGAILENRSGALVDTLFVYAVARLAIRTRADLVKVAKVVAVIVLFLAILGVMESYSGWSPYSPLKAYDPWSRHISADPEQSMRLGLYRAGGAGGNSIVFGMTFVLVMPLVMVLFREGANLRLLGGAATIACVAGAFSSMSSGPFMSMVIFIFCALLVYKPDLVKPILVILFLVCVAAEVGSNRHFYHLIGYLALGSSATWYRSRLFDLALQDLPKYWTFGYGFKDPGWGLLLDGRSYTDLCNNYVLLAVTQGAAAALLFIGILVEAVRRARKAYKASYPAAFSDAAWFIGSLFVALGMGLYSIGLLGAMQSIFYVMLGVVAGRLFDASVPDGDTRVRWKLRAVRRLQSKTPRTQRTAVAPPREKAE